MCCYNSAKENKCIIFCVIVTDTFFFRKAIQLFCKPDSNKEENLYFETKKVNKFDGQVSLQYHLIPIMRYFKWDIQI